jgi:hypothetical protein
MSSQQELETLLERNSLLGSKRTCRETDTLIVWEEVLPVLLRSLWDRRTAPILVEQGATRPGNIFYKWRFTNVPEKMYSNALVKCKPRLSTGGGSEEISGEKLLQQNGLFLRRGYCGNG